MEEDLGILRTQRAVDEHVPNYLDLLVIELAVTRHCAQLVERILDCADHFFMFAVELEYMRGYVLWLYFES